MNESNIQNNDDSLKNWDEIQKYFNKRTNDYLKKKPIEWIFRGESNDNQLATALERALLIHIGKSSLVEVENNNKSITITDFEKKLKELYLKDIRLHNIEYAMLREFQRKCQHYISPIPDNDQIIEWIALLQHYGAPTRLMDWTYSPYVALYFALEKAVNDCYVYEINYTKLVSFAKNKFRWYTSYWHDTTASREKKIKNILFTKREPNFAYVIPLTPYYLNERIINQRGTFLSNTKLSVPFIISFWNTIKEIADSFKKIKIDLSNPEKRIEYLKHLEQMNINYSTLFPGLMGFTKDLGIKFKYPTSKRW